MEMNNKSNRKLLVALAVMAVAFVALAAIPAVDAEDAGVAGGGQTEAIDTYDELSDALAKGGKVVLGGDIDMSGKAAITVDTNVELDLAGHSITKVQAEIKSAQDFTSENRMKVFIVNPGVTMTINDTVGEGKIVGKSYDGKMPVYGSASGDQVLSVGDGDKLATLKLGKITIVSDFYGVGVWANGAVEATGTTIKTVYASTLGLNGSDTIGSKNAKVTIDGGTYSSKYSPAFFWSNTEELKISNAKIEGSAALDIRAGSAQLTDVQINMTEQSSGTVGSSGPAGFNVGIGIYANAGESYGNPSVTLQKVSFKSAAGIDVDAQIYYGVLKLTSEEQSFEEIVNADLSNETLNHYAKLTIMGTDGKVATAITAAEKANASRMLLSIDGKELAGDSVLDKVSFVGDVSFSKKGQTLSMTNGASFKGALSYSDSTAKLNLKAGTEGLTISAGSLEFDGDYEINETTEAGKTVIEIVSGTAVVSDNMTIPEGTVVKVAENAKLIVEDKTLTVNGKLEVANGAEFENEGTVTVTGENASIEAEAGSKVTPGTMDYYPVYAEGAKVVIEGNEYIVHHYRSGGVDIQYGVSCGDVFYTGAKLDEYDVSVLAICLDEDYTMTNKVFSLVDSKDGIGGWKEIKDAGTYTEAVKIQLTFVKGASNITENIKTDLVVKPLPIFIKFEAPEKFGDIDTSEFQNIEFADGEITGKIGYYNLNGMDGYYLVISAKVVDGKGVKISDATISSSLSFEKQGDIYVFDLGKDATKAAEKLDGIMFSVDAGDNYSKPSYKFASEVEVVEPMAIDAISGDVLGASVDSLHGSDLDIAVDNDDATSFNVTGTLLWKAGYTKFNTAVPDEQRGWYLAVEFQAASDYKWNLCKADLKVLKEKTDVALTDGQFIFRVVDVDANPEIVLKDVNGFKTKYVLNIGDVEFGTASGYGETKDEVEVAMGALGIDVNKLTDKGSDVVDKTMFMIFNTSAFKGDELTATATSTNGKVSYTEKFAFNGNIGIWYFSFDDQAKDKGVPGPYDLEVKSGTTTVAEGVATMKGVYVYSYGFRADATEAYNIIHGLRSDIPQSDVAPNTFWMIVGIYGYADATEVAASMVGTDGNEILMGVDNSITLPGTEGEAHKWAFYFSFENSEQVDKPANIYGNYTMSLKADETVIASEKILVATSSSMSFDVADKVDEQGKDVFGSDLKVETDGMNVTLSGKMNYIRSEDSNGYLFPISMTIATSYTGATLTIDGEAAEFGAMLLKVSADKKTFKVVVDLDGAGDVYSSTTYTLTFNGSFEKVSYGILLSDPFYGKEPILYGTSIVGKSFYLPNGPDASKDFIGWQIEGKDGKIYSAGAFVIMTEGMDDDGNGDVVFTAVYDDSEPELVAIFIDGMLYCKKLPYDVITLPTLEGTGYVAWAVSGTVLGAQYIVNTDDAPDGVIRITGVTQPVGLQRTQYDLEVELTVEGAVLSVTSPQTDSQYFNMNGAFYYLIVTSSGSKVVVPEGIYAFGSSCTDKTVVDYPGLIGRNCIVQFVVDYGMQSIVLDEFEYYSTIGGYCDSAEDANFEISDASEKKIEDAVDKTAYIVFEADAAGTYTAECTSDGKTVCSETFTIDSIDDGEKFAWYFTFDGPRNASTVSPVDISKDFKEGAEYLITVKDSSGAIIAAATFVIPGA